MLNVFVIDWQKTQKISWINPNKFLSRKDTLNMPINYQLIKDFKTEYRNSMFGIVSKRKYKISPRSVISTNTHPPTHTHTHTHTLKHLCEWIFLNDSHCSLGWNPSIDWKKNVCLLENRIEFSLWNAVCVCGCVY